MQRATLQGCYSAVCYTCSWFLRQCWWLQLTEPTVGEKRCSECGEHKPANQFYKNRTNKDGLFGKCKLCSEGTKKERALNDVTVDRKVILLADECADHLQVCLARHLY